MSKPFPMNLPDRLESPRLRMRVPTVHDAGMICATALESLPELKPWMPWATDDYSEKSAEDWCRRASSRHPLSEELPLLIFDRRDDRHLGNISLFKIDWETPKGEIGYWLGTKFNGQGFMTEAVNAISHTAFDALKFARLEIRTDEQNHKSRRVAERCGFKLEGVLRREARDTAGQLRDLCIYGKISD